VLTFEEAVERRLFFIYFDKATFFPNIKKTEKIIAKRTENLEGECADEKETRNKSTTRNKKYVFHFRVFKHKLYCTI